MLVDNKDFDETIDENTHNAEFADETVSPRSEVDELTEISADAEEIPNKSETTEFVESTETEESSSVKNDVEDEDNPNGPHWYVLHTYSGYEAKVKRTIEQIVQNRSLQDYILDLEVPEEEVVEVKDGKKKTVMRKIFPGYVLINMRMNDDIWFIVRNVHGVTGFVGPDSEPVPLRDEELAMMGIDTGWVPDVDYEVGDSVRIINGPFESFIGTVEELNFEKRKVSLSVSMFGRETPVELDFTQVMSI